MSSIESFENFAESPLNKAEQEHHESLQALQALLDERKTTIRALKDLQNPVYMRYEKALTDLNAVLMAEVRAEAA